MTMAVETLYRSSYDPEKIFLDKNEADEHDKMLELAEGLGDVLLKKACPSLTEQQVEEISIYMAKRRDVFAKVFRKQPDLLKELLIEGEAKQAPAETATSGQPETDAESEAA